MKLSVKCRFAVGFAVAVLACSGCASSRKPDPTFGNVITTRRPTEATALRTTTSPDSITSPDRKRPRPREFRP